MSLSPAELIRIAQLARIDLPSAEIEPTCAQLNHIFGFIEQLRAAPTDGIVPMSHAVELSQRLRDDVVTETNQREKFQAIAPDTEGGLYLVPKVME
ncbi:MAG: Asp-tRNA(Asn)/Glu-tRNA(Gln) amidotransferase subunit GatC [Rhodocyclaceae bacterium]|nr:Asp-tRNA(Asn)/Glu-tRNA(Gln) amidotransferase subunit GatC [Rhodocyclaceae bacterium]MBP6279559.1 Asp-tRNA(Asn)/Glu-tRNA(Gln) amidotransferase subunit GatC [Rhodocyclaceae bacterium]